MDGRRLVPCHVVGMVAERYASPFRKPRLSFDGPHGNVAVSDDDGDDDDAVCVMAKSACGHAQLSHLEILEAVEEGNSWSISPPCEKMDVSFRSSLVFRHRDWQRW